MVFLNHGSFGACPRPVFEEYQRWQRELERQPVEFLDRRWDELLGEARALLAGSLGARAEDLVFVPNATTGVNTVARSLRLGPDDEVLTTDHEYGAIDLTWEATGARVVRRPIESVWEGVSDRTRVLAVSHVTSPTGIVVDVGELCRRARAAGIIGVVDGAHGPGHVPVGLGALGADAYAGNCHNRQTLMGPPPSVATNQHSGRERVGVPKAAMRGVHLVAGSLSRVAGDARPGNNARSARVSVR